jgi:hypothetical protein
VRKSTLPTQRNQRSTNCTQPATARVSQVRSEFPPTAHRHDRKFTLRQHPRHSAACRLGRGLTNMPMWVRDASNWQEPRTGRWRRANA